VAGYRGWGATSDYPFFGLGLWEILILSLPDFTAAEPKDPGSPSTS